MRSARTLQPAEELHLGGGGMWAPMVPPSSEPEEWTCQVDEDDAPSIVRSLD